jgi:hypothetical protein
MTSRTEIATDWKLARKLGDWSLLPPTPGSLFKQATDELVIDQSGKCGEDFLFSPKWTVSSTPGLFRGPGLF